MSQSQKQMQIEIINNTPMDHLRFKDFTALKVGRSDEFSAIRGKKLEARISLDLLAEIQKALPHDFKSQHSAIRWVLRGLELYRAIRKVKTDGEVSANAEHARVEKEFWESNGADDFALDAMKNEEPLDAIIHPRPETEFVISGYTILRSFPNLATIANSTGEVVAEKEIRNETHWENFLRKFRDDAKYRQECTASALGAGSTNTPSSQIHATTNVALIDFEFTGLDSEFITTNEIVQAKVKNLGTGKSVLGNYSSDRPLTAYVRLTHKVERYPGDKFSSEAFDSLLTEAGCDAATEFWGWSTSEDLKMLRKYGIEIKIADIQERLRLTDEYETRMAAEGSGLEAVYLLATGEIVEADHAGVGELDLIHKLYDVAQSLTPRKHLTVMPYGFARGMRISDYVVKHRRTADGYRYHNSDLLAASLTAEIPDSVHHYNDEGEDFLDDDDSDFDEDEYVDDDCDTDGE